MLGFEESLRLPSSGPTWLPFLFVSCVTFFSPFVFFFVFVAGVFQLGWSFVRAPGGSAIEGKCFGWLRCYPGVSSGSVHTNKRSLDGVSFVFVRMCVCLNTRGGLN